MSKIVETLNNPFKKVTVRSSAQEEIAKIYLKVSDKSKGRNTRRPSRVPWIMAAAAFFLAISVLLFKSNIDIKIRVLGEMPSIGPSRTDSFGSLGEKGLYLVRDSQVNTYLVKSADFSGDAKTFSKIGNGAIVLCNSRGSGWANYEISFKEPLDLTRLDLRYTSKGERGEEYLSVVLVDSDNRSYRVEKDISSKLSQEWQTHTLNFKPFKKAVDLANISTVRFEFGSLTAGNSPMATLYLKDICVVKTKRMGL